MTTITQVNARQILDCRGNPTVEAEIRVESGEIARGSAPSGASTGSYEAIELRDGEQIFFRGMGVQNAVNAINGEIADTLVGRDALEQNRLDRVLIDLDGTPNKGRLGANAILAVSIAIAKVAANACKQPLYRYLGGVKARKLPVPMMNIINGGMHANNSLDIQEFMIVPTGAPSFSEALRWGVEVFQSLKSDLESKGYSTAVGDEGGFAPKLKNNSESLDLIMEAIIRAGLKPGSDVGLALDVAATELIVNGKYQLSGEGAEFTQDQFIDYQETLCRTFPIISIEDPLGEDDWEGWSKITGRLGDKVQIVGDDLFVTNTNRIKEGIDKQAANAVLIKMNQIGTITETLEAVEMAQTAQMQAIVSHRSGETEDTTIADLAVATNSGQIKTGSVSRTDRVAKYNQLLRIEEELDMCGHYAGINATV
ncbi:MAG: phosphopyruvate hydratase [Rhodospirillaceae bacterium]|nr:phosphopyruvate hydratase [Rhodospirillaceae bacterium]